MRSLKDAHDCDCSLGLVLLKEKIKYKYSRATRSEDEIIIKVNSQKLEPEMNQEIEIKNLDHLGLVAGIVDELGIEKLVDEAVGIDKREKIRGK